MVADLTCVFASCDTICAAASAIVDESTIVAISNSSSLFAQLYHTVYNEHCNTEITPMCSLCGNKCRHCASSNLCWTVRPVPQSESVDVLLREPGKFDGCITADSLACNKGYYVLSEAVTTV